MCSLLLACDGGSTATIDSGSMPADTSAVAVDASPCGVRSGKRGKTNRMITAAGLDRTYIVYLPEAADPKTPLPLVFVHHGYTMSAESMFDITGYPALADREGVALAFPDGQGGPDSLNAPWNVGSDVCPSFSGPPPIAAGDDFALLDAIKADIAQDQCIDDAHVFVTGFSMGGYFSHHAGCMRSDIRAIAPHSGGTHALDDCTAGHKPVIMVHGKADPLIPVGCDDPTAAFIPPDVTPAATAWAAKNGCGTTTHSVDVDGGTCSYYDGCPEDGQVEICTFDAMGHCWAGGKPGSIYPCPTYAKATELEWSFFKDHAW
jgi:polyhydroxybutyrate depolymerase